MIKPTSPSKYNISSSQPLPIKIVFVHDTNTYGGLEIYLLRFLRRLNRELFKPHVMVPGYTDSFRASPQKFINKVREMKVPLLRPNHPGDVRGLSAIRDIKNMRQLLSQVDADIVHIHTSYPEGAQKVIVSAQTTNVSLIMRTEHCSPLLFGNNGSYWTKTFDRMTDKIITVSENNRQEQIDIVGRPPEKVYTSYTGVDLKQFNPDHDVDQAKTTLGLSPELPVIGAVGRLTTVKGFSFFIEAASIILKEFGPINFLLVGDGELETELKEQVNRLNLTNFFHFAGYQSNPIPYIEAMDITVMSSLSEGFPLSLLEYMAMGKPTVVTDYPTILEAVSSSENSIIVPRKDSMALAQGLLKLLQNPDRASQMGITSRKRMEAKFDFQSHVEDITNLYLRELESKRISKE